MDPTTTVREFLFTLLLKVAVASSVAALLVRWGSFRRVIFTEQRDPDQKLKLMLFMVAPLILGVTLRLIGSGGITYSFADLSLEGAFLMGLLGGRVVGPIGGAIITIPALVGHEWLAMPAASAAGLLGGLIRQAIPNKEDLWNFGPFTFLNIPKATVRLLRKAELSWEMAPLATCVGLEVGRVALVLATKPKWLFAIHAKWDWWLILAVIATLMSVASRQINPHFLFNTLNTVTALIRFDPDMARGVVLKLSNILRRLLRKHETFVPLREELDFIDDYLDIEVIRFGRDKLQIFKEVEAETLDAFVPSMLLQPMIENSIKHGLAPRLEGGQIHIRTHRRDGRLFVEIADNGLGIPADRLAEVYGGGIGISNVHERLRLLYGDQFKMDIRSQEGEGTQIHIEIPELVTAEHTPA